MQQSLITASIHTRDLLLQGQQSNGDALPQTALHGRKLHSHARASAPALRLQRAEASDP
jgi:hypothetical protein